MPQADDDGIVCSAEAMRAFRRCSRVTYETALHIRVGNTILGESRTPLSPAYSRATRRAMTLLHQVGRRRSHPLSVLCR